MKRPLIMISILVLLAAACLATSFNRIIYPIKTKDASGYELKQDKAPDSIVCASPAVAEILFAFNLQDKIVGVTKNCNYPDGANKLNKVGDKKVDRNTMAKLKPDLVIIPLSDYKKEEIEALRNIRFMTTVTFETWTGDMSTEVRQVSLEVFAIDPKSTVDVLNTINTIGTITNREHSAYSLKQKMSRRIGWVEARARSDKKFRRMRAIVLTSRHPLSVAGSDTYLNDIINTEGFINVSKKGKEASVKMDWKEIEAADPDIVITSSDVARNPKDIYNSRDFRKTNAGKNKMVICIDKDIFDRPGPRVVNMLEQIGEFAYGWSSTSESNEQ
jgi:iron complex transport system substrate-binding protein